VRRYRPCSRCTANEGEKLAARRHSITSSARNENGFENHAQLAADARATEGQAAALACGMTNLRLSFEPLERVQRHG
jgi:hypothetical protein